MKQDKTKLYAGAAIALALAAGGGFGLAKLTGPKSEPQAAETIQAATTDVAMDAQTIRANGIVTETVTAGGFAGEVFGPATVVASPNGEALLTARAAGAVIRINKRLGDPVRAGEALAVVESREAAQIAADRLAANAKANLAQKTFAREKRLFEQRVSARQDFEAAEAEAAAAAAEARRAQTAASAANVTSDGRGVVVTSPINGRVTAAAVSLGAFVQPETELFRVADASRIQVEVAISGLDTARVTPGDRAVVETADGRTIEGAVRSITPSLNAETRTATAVLDVPATGLQPGQTLRARLFSKTPANSRSIVLPEDALQTVGGRDAVFVKTAQGFEARPVTLGQRSNGRIEVVSGVSPGQAVVIRNAFLLKAELAKSEGEEE